MNPNMWAQLQAMGRPVSSLYGHPVPMGMMNRGGPMPMMGQGVPQGMPMMPQGLSRAPGIAQLPIQAQPLMRNPMLRNG